MQVVDKNISIAELKKMAEKNFANLVKAVVDIQKEIMAVDAELHSDQERVLIEEYDSEQGNLWGINLHPDIEGENFIAFDSMINLRPSWGNRSRGVDDPKIQEKIRTIVNRMVVK